MQQGIMKIRLNRSGGIMHSKVILFLVSFIFLFNFQIFPQTENRTCRIKSMIGSVKIRKNGTVNWMNARVGMPVRERDGLRTFVESEAELETSEGTTIKVGENSTFELSEFQQNKDVQKTKVKIMNGSMLSNVKKLVNPSSSFEFETPTATAAIRGTTVGLDVNKEQTNIKVYEGKVFVAPRGKKNGTVLKDNEMTSVSKKTKVITVEQISAKDRSAKPDSLDTDIVVDTLKNDTILNQDTSSSAPVDTILKKELNNDSLPDPKNIGVSKDNLDEEKSDIPLNLKVISPVEGIFVLPSTQLTVSGSVTPFNATITVNSKAVSTGPGGTFKTILTTPQTYGDFEVNITSDFEGRSQTVIRTLKIKSPELNFSISTPKDKQVFSKPLIPVTGTVTAGAEVTVMSMNVPVTVQGTFNTQFPIPNEDGEHTLEFEASLDGKIQKINRTVIFKPEYRFTLSQPQDRQTISSTTIQVKGEVVPVNSSISVQGKRIAVSSLGTFFGVVNIPDEEGEVVIEIEIESNGMIKNEKRTLFYKRPPDTYAPQIQGVLPTSTQSPRIPFTVFDRTIDEEITLYWEIDGVKESQSARPNTAVYITLQEGIHSYKVYATDKAGNSSQTVSQTVSYLGASVWNIRLRKPVGDIAIDLPPSTPDGNYKPKYPVEFSIDDLPDDNIKLIREITVTNSTTSETIKLRNLTDTYIDVDIGISHRASNILLIEALDVNNIKKTKKLQIHVR